MLEFLWWAILVTAGYWLKIGVEYYRKNIKPRM